MTVTTAPPAPVDERARTAVLACIGRFGLAKTTIDDIAREAGCSRATLYRYFDGKPEIVGSAVAAEHARIAGVVVDAGRAAPTFADAVVAVVSSATTTRCGSSSCTNPTRCSVTWRSVPATVSSSRWATR